MQLRPDIQLQTVIKAMMEDVIPAMDQTNQLAMQSAQLTIGTLTMIAQHLPLAYRFDCDELSRLVDTAKLLKEQVDGGSETKVAVDNLKLAQAVAEDVLSRAKAEPSEILDAIRTLRSATGDTVRAVYEEGEERVIKTVESTVLDSSKQQLLRDRSWLLMQGWEPDPESVPAIESLLPAIAKG